MAPSLEGSREPEIDKALGKLHGNHPLSNGEDVRVVVLAGELRGLLAPSNSTANPLHLVGGDGLAVPRTTDDDPLLGLALCHFLGGRDAPEGIVGGVGGMGAAVDHLVPL